MTHPGKPKQVKAIAVVMALVMAAVSLGIGGSVLAAPEPAAIFKTDFSGLKNGTISTTDTATVEALEKSFYIYNAQRAEQNGQTSYFERNEVNGYLVSDGSALGKPKFPDTGIYPGWDLDGYGTAEAKPIPEWSIADGWLSCSAYNEADAFLFRQGNFLYVKDDTISGFAAIKNFTLETGFKFSTTEENDALSVIFHARDAGPVIDPYQCVLAFNANGKIYLGKPRNYETGVDYNGELKAKDGSTLKLEKERTYSLSITVVGSSLTLTIKDGKNDLCTYQTSDLPATGYENGYLAIGVSNNGPAIADVQVQQLDDTGKTVDFGTAMPGYPFGFAATTLCDWRTYYYADFGDGAQVIWENWYIRNSNDLYWYDFWSTRRGDSCWLGDGMSAANQLISGLFATYHEQISTTNGKRLFGKSNMFSDRINAELMLGDGQVSGQGYVGGGNRLLLLEDAPQHKLLSQAMTIAPKTAAGEQIITKNFETSFGAILFNDPEKAIAVSFRSGSPGAMLKDDASAGYADKVTVVFSGAGYKILDGESLAVSGNSFTPWDGGAAPYPPGWGCSHAAGPAPRCAAAPEA